VWRLHLVDDLVARIDGTPCDRQTSAAGSGRAPFDIATRKDHTGLDAFTGKEVHVAKHRRGRRLQRALLQFFNPDNDVDVPKEKRCSRPAGPT
jgi:hypothetical protein